jgi:hypothetical protein
MLTSEAAVVLSFNEKYDSCWLGNLGNDAIHAERSILAGNEGSTIWLNGSKSVIM